MMPTRAGFARAPALGRPMIAPPLSAKTTYFWGTQAAHRRHEAKRAADPEDNAVADDQLVDAPRARARQEPRGPRRRAKERRRDGARAAQQFADDEAAAGEACGDKSAAPDRASTPRAAQASMVLPTRATFVVGTSGHSSMMPRYTVPKL